MAIGDGAIERSKGTLRNSVIEVLKEAISTGVIARGDKINETAEAERLGVSRGTLREALRELEAQGYVKNVPYRGTFVPELSAEEIYNFCTARGAVEGYAAAQGIAQIRAEVQSLHEIVRQMRVELAAGNWGKITNLDRDFHRLICGAGGNQYLLQMWSLQSGPILGQFASRLNELYTAENMVERHSSIAEVLAGGSPADIEAIIRTHYVDAARRYQQYLGRASQGTAAEEGDV